MTEFFSLREHVERDGPKDIPEGTLHIEWNKCYYDSGSYGTESTKCFFLYIYIDNEWYPIFEIGDGCDSDEESIYFVRGIHGSPDMPVVYNYENSFLRDKRDDYFKVEDIVSNIKNNKIKETEKKYLCNLEKDLNEFDEIINYIYSNNKFIGGIYESLDMIIKNIEKRDPSKKNIFKKFETLRKIKKDFDNELEIIYALLDNSLK